MTVLVFFLGSVFGVSICIFIKLFLGRSPTTLNRLRSFDEAVLFRGKGEIYIPPETEIEKTKETREEKKYGKTKE